MKLLIIILVILILLVIVRYSNNMDLVKNNSKDINLDKLNVKNARKYFNKQKTFVVLFWVAIFSFIAILFCHQTRIDTIIIDYFSIGFYEEQEFNKALYLFPIYVLVIRELIIDVKIGDFLFKYYKVKEPELEEGLLKAILFKKKPSDSDKVKDEGKVNSDIKNTNDANNVSNLEIKSK